MAQGGLCAFASPPLGGTSSPWGLHPLLGVNPLAAGPSTHLGEVPRSGPDGGMSWFAQFDFLVGCGKKSTAHKELLPCTMGTSVSNWGLRQKIKLMLSSLLPAHAQQWLNRKAGQAKSRQLPERGSQQNRSSTEIAASLKIMQLNSRSECSSYAFAASAKAELLTKIINKSIKMVPTLFIDLERGRGSAAAASLPSSPLAVPPAREGLALQSLGQQ